MARNDLKLTDIIGNWIVYQSEFTEFKSIA